MRFSLRLERRHVTLSRRSSLNSGERDGFGNPGTEVDAAHAGQIIVLFAFFLTACLGILGLATDLGYAYAAKRTMQNAADAGAIAGTRQIAKWTQQNRFAVEPEVRQLVTANTIGTVETRLRSCHYMIKNSNTANYNLTEGGSCNALITGAQNIVGVQVVADEEHATFFMRLFGFNTVTTSATATAAVVRLRHNDAPFIVCGYDTNLAPNNALSTQTFSILDAQQNVQDEAFGRHYVVHHPQSNGNNTRVENCEQAGGPSMPASFKGLGDNGNLNNNATVPGTWFGRTGTVAGPTRVKVNGIEGCGQNASVNGCVALLPIAVRGEPNGPSPSFDVVAMLAFRLQSCGSNAHCGTLLKDYVAFGEAEWNWNLGDAAVTFPKLVR